MPSLDLVPEPSEVGFQDTQHCYGIDCELTRLAIAPLPELDDVKVAKADLTWVDG